MSSDKSYATVIYPDGSSTALALPLAADRRLSAIQEMVGGCIEGIPLSSGRYMFLSEDGKASAVNHIATEIAREAKSIMADDYIAGVAVIVSTEFPD